MSSTASVMHGNVQTVYRTVVVVIGGLLGLVGVGGYCAFPLQWVVGSTLSPLHAYISELSVAGQPGVLLFRAADGIAGVGLTALAAALAVWLPTGRIWAGSFALVVAGGASIVDAAVPMPCAPSIDQHCRSIDRAGLIGQLSQPHTVSGVVGFAAVLLAMAAFSSGLCHVRGEHRLGHWGWGATVYGIALGVIEIVMVLRDIRCVGLLERVQVGVIGTWLAVLAVCMLTESLSTATSMAGATGEVLASERNRPDRA